MQTELEGYYLDGRTAARQRVMIRPTSMGLQMMTEKGGTFFWPYEEIRWSGSMGDDEQMRVERGGEIPEVLLVPAGLFKQAVRFAAPEQARRFNKGGARGSKLLTVLGSAVGAGVVLLALYLWGIPTLASVIAPHVPLKWEENLGQGVVEYFAPRARQCRDPVRTQAINEIMRRLNASASKSRYTFRVIVVNDPMINALAAPGGYILIFRGLLERTETPEELAGVLAHEMQHVLHGHATRQILQHASINVLLTAMTGDASSAMSYGLGAASTLGLLRYGRQYEEEADREAIRLLAVAKIDPMGLARFFEIMKREDGLSGIIPAYLSTHPNLNERIANAKMLADQAGIIAPRLLQDYNWREISDVCRTTGPKLNP